MKDRAANGIGISEQLNDWSQINWRTVNRRVRNLRRRIFRATQNRQWNKVRSLMKLMLRSFSNLLISVRRVTQENTGKRTAGIDGQKVLTPADRVKLVQQMREYTPWQVCPTKRIYIPKAKGSFRSLSIPVIKDRVAQTIVKNALEPSWEATFEASSFGFRPGRSVQDAIEATFSRFGKGLDQWTLDADIRGAFDNISHNFLISALGQVPGRELIKQWLIAGYMEMGKVHHNSTGVPQGGCLSPLLANICLDGLGKLLKEFQTLDKYVTAKGKKTSKWRSTYGYIRYCDDFLITARLKVEIESIIPIIENWLKQRGLELNRDKTRIVHISEGFNFLGYNVRKYEGKCLIKPQKQKVLDFLKQIGSWLKRNKQTTASAVIAHLNPILRGWGNFYRNAVSSRTFSYVDHRVFRMLIKWAYRKHRNKGKKWVIKKYFQPNNNWKFYDKISDRQGSKNILTLVKLSEIPINRHIKVKDTASPDDPSLSKYWQDRATRYGKTLWIKGSRPYLIAEKQNWLCPVCGNHLFNGEQIETHHIKRVKDGGKDDIANLVHLHKTCHHALHSGKRSRLAEA